MKMYKKCDMFDILYPTMKGTIRADGFPGHFIGSHKCRFRLHHHILSIDGNRYRVSTVGLYLPSSQGYTYEGLGADGKLFETMVFKEKVINGYLDFASDELCCMRCDDAEAATKIHYDAVAEYLGR